MRFRLPPCVLFCAALALVSIPTLVAAQAPSACPAPEARQFDFWIGEWNVVNRGLTAEGWVETGRATTKVFPVLDGCAIVELWRGTAWNRKTLGFSVRNFNPETGKWFLLLNWPDAGVPDFGSLEGVFNHGRGEFFLDATDAQGKPEKKRYTFSDATPDSLRWDAARSGDDGKSWTTYWIMEFTRRDPMSDLPLWNGAWLADGRSRLCTQAQAAQLDFLAGGWEGTERRESKQWGTPVDTSSQHSVRMHVLPILEGCASLEFAEVSGPDPYERFAVRAWSPQQERWIQYEMNTGDSAFIQSSGVASEKGIEFHSTEGREGPGGLAWQLSDDGTLTREETLNVGNGAVATRSSWRLKATAHGVHPPP